MNKFLCLFSITFVPNLCMLTCSIMRKIFRLYILTSYISLSPLSPSCPFSVQPTACATPSKLKAWGWEMLTPASLACPPAVWVPEPMVAVATGQTATLACLVNENASNQQVYWLDSKGVVIVNNSGSVTPSISRQDASGDSSSERRIQKYTISKGPVFIGALNSHESDRTISAFGGEGTMLRRQHSMALDRGGKASVRSSIIITPALTYRNKELLMAANGKESTAPNEIHGDEGGNMMSVNEANPYNADEYPDTRDPFLVSNRK